MLRKREELTAVRPTLAERELGAPRFSSQLAAFEGRYLRQVGALYAELDDWKARIAELHVRLHPSAASKAQAESSRERARRTYDEAHSKASEARDFNPSAELKRLFRDVAKCVHPDLADDAGDLERRTRFMAEANRAYAVGDTEALQRILDEYQHGAEAVEGEGIGVDLIRIIRQISLARTRLSVVEQEMAALQQSEIALLKKQAENSEQKGKDLLSELAAAAQEQIDLARKEYEALALQEANA